MVTLFPLFESIVKLELSSSYLLWNQWFREFESIVKLELSSSQPSKRYCRK